MSETDSIDRDEFRAAAREALADICSPASVRSGIDSRLTCPRSVLKDWTWGSISSMGWTGIDIGEEFGGAGATFSDLTVVLIELGAFLTPSSLPATSVLAATALSATHDQPRSSSLLTEVASGSAVLTSTIAIDDIVDATSRPIRYERTSGGLFVSGSVSHVLGASDASTIVVAAHGEDGPMVMTIDRAVPGLEVEPLAMLDFTRQFDRVSMHNISIDPEAVLAVGPNARQVIESVFDRTALALACDALGAAETLLARTVEYVSQRTQFGRAVGSFQAVKHQCADMFLLVATARIAVEAAAASVTRGDPAAALSISRAKSYVTDAASRVGDYAVRLRGGIGVTWEDDTHLFVKRIAVDQTFAGSSRWHRKRIADLTFGPAHRTTVGA